LSWWDSAVGKNVCFEKQWISLIEQAWQSNWFQIVHPKAMGEPLADVATRQAVMAGAVVGRFCYVGRGGDH